MVFGAKFNALAFALTVNVILCHHARKQCRQKTSKVAARCSIRSDTKLIARDTANNSQTISLEHLITTLGPECHCLFRNVTEIASLAKKIQASKFFLCMSNSHLDSVLL